MTRKVNLCLQLCPILLLKNDPFWDEFLGSFVFTRCGYFLNNWFVTSLERFKGVIKEESRWTERKRTVKRTKKIQKRSLGMFFDLEKQIMVIVGIVGWWKFWRKNLKVNWRFDHMEDLQAFFNIWTSEITDLTCHEFWKVIHQFLNNPATIFFRNSSNLF